MQRTIAINVEKESDNEVNLTPVLDVVFIMLIFFIVTASFVKETGIDESSGIWIERRLIDPRAVRANIERLRADQAEFSINSNL